MFRKLFALGAPLAMAASLLSAPVAHADPVDDCDFVPLNYTRNWSAGGETFTTRYQLKVYDLCDAGTVTGFEGFRPREDSTFGDFRPITPSWNYKRQLDQSWQHEGINRLTRAGNSQGYRLWRFSTDDIDFDPSGGYFMSIRLRWHVEVDGDDYNRTTVCDRIHSSGSHAWDCHAG